MKFTALHTVRFSDCDPAGIVFYPQYFVMLNTFIEQWFDDGLGISYAGLIGVRRIGLPTVRLEVDFSAVSRHGDVLSLSTEIERLGRSSLTLRSAFHAGTEQRLSLRQVLVCTSLATHKPLPLPDDVRAALARYLPDKPTARSAP